jgi:hypothetical protein
MLAAASNIAATKVEIPSLMSALQLALAISRLAI